MSLVRLWDTFQESICAGFKMLGKPDERRDTERIFAAFDAANGLGVNTHQFRQAFLRQIRPQAGVGHVATDNAQENLV